MGERAEKHISAVRRAVIDCFFLLCMAIGAVLISAGVCFAACTIAKGAPNIFGRYFLYVDDTRFSVLPRNDLLFYSPCAAGDLKRGDYAAFGTSGGAAVGVILDTDEKQGYITVTLSDGGDVAALPPSSLLGRIDMHNPAAGAVLDVLVRSRFAVAAISAAVALWTAVSLAADFASDRRFDLKSGFRSV